MTVRPSSAPLAPTLSDVSFVANAYIPSVVEGAYPANDASPSEEECRKHILKLVEDLKEGIPQIKRQQNLIKIAKLVGKMPEGLSKDEMQYLDHQGNHKLFYVKVSESLGQTPRDQKYFFFFRSASELIVPDCGLSIQDQKSIREFIYDLCKFIVMYDDYLDNKELIMKNPQFAQLFVGKIKDFLKQLYKNPNSPVVEVHHPNLTPEENDYMHATKRWLYLAFQKVKHFSGLKNAQVQQFIAEAFDTFLDSCIYGDTVSLTVLESLSDLPELAEYMHQAEASASTPCMMAVASALKPEWIEHYKQLSHHIAVLVRYINEMYGVKKDLIDGSANAVIFEALQQGELSLNELQGLYAESNAFKVLVDAKKILPGDPRCSEMENLIQNTLSKFMKPDSRAVQTIAKAFEDKLLEMQEAIRNMPPELKAESYLKRILSFMLQYFRLCDEQIRETWFQALDPELGKKLRENF